MLSRVFRVGTTLVVLGLAASTALAQGGGRGGAGGGRGGFGGFNMQRGTATELLGLLATPEIRKEVKLSDEGFAAVDKLLKENEAARGAGMFGGRGGAPGGGAGGAAPGGAEAPPADPEREARMKEFQQRMADGVKKTDEAVLGALSDAQKKSLEQLKGAKFEFPESLKNPRMAFGMGGGGFGGGAGGPGAGGPGAGGGRGGAGGGERPSQEEMQKAMEKMRTDRAERAAKAQELLDEVLPPEGLDRLIGLYVQLRGNSTVTGELPAKKLGLSEADITKINEAVQKVNQEMFQGMGGGRGNRGGQRPGADTGT